MHLTVCRHDEASFDVAEITRSLERALPVSCEVKGLLIVEMNAAGQVRVLPLG